MSLRKVARIIPPKHVQLDYQSYVVGITTIGNGNVSEQTRPGVFGRQQLFQIQYLVMKFLRRLWPFAALIVLLILWASLRYHASEFKGGVSMRSSGSWISPHYRAELQPVSLNTPGDQRYALSGLPSDTFSLNLLIDSPQSETRRATSSVQTRLSVMLTDDSGNKLCSADGTIAGVQDIWNSTWIFARTANWAYLWTPKCLDMPIDRRKRYHLTISVVDIDPTSPKVNLIPILRGGGNELP